MFNILCLSGGGYMGLYTASILAGLEAKYQKPIASSFDLIAGTSVGGIIAMGLANETPAADIKRAFEQHGQSIFSNRPAPRSEIARWCDIGRSLFSPKYSSDGLRDAVLSILGPDLLLGDLKHNVIIPAVNLTKGLPQFFKTPHHQTFQRDHLLKAVDVALATSAAPTYFPLAQIGDSLFTDGGVYANSPDLVALHEATHFFEQSDTNVRLVSIGTTTSQLSFAHTAGKEYGLFKWAAGQKLVKTIISSQQHSVNYMMQHKLKERFLRIDVNQSPEQDRDLALDVATQEAKATLRGLAEGSLQAVLSNALLHDICSNSVPSPTFFHGNRKNS